MLLKKTFNVLVLLIVLNLFLLSNEIETNQIKKVHLRNNLQRSKLFSLCNNENNSSSFNPAISAFIERKGEIRF